jgi:hypothetical protein
VNVNLTIDQGISKAIALRKKVKTGSYEFDVKAGKILKLQAFCFGPSPWRNPKRDWVLDYDLTHNILLKYSEIYLARIIAIADSCSSRVGSTKTYYNDSLFNSVLSTNSSGDYKTANVIVRPDGTKFKRYYATRKLRVENWLILEKTGDTEQKFIFKTATRANVKLYRWAGLPHAMEIRDAIFIKDKKKQKEILTLGIADAI